MSKLYVDQILPNSSQQVTIGSSGGTPTFLGSSFVGEVKQMRQRRATSPSFPYWNLSNPSSILQSANYPDYVEYLRSIAVEVPFTPTALTSSGSVNNSNSLTLTGYSANPSHVGRWVAILNSDTPSLQNNGNYQFRIITSSNANNITLDAPVTMASGYLIHLLDHNSFTDRFTATTVSGNSITLVDGSVSRVLFSALWDDFSFGFMGEDSDATRITNRIADWNMVISICSGSTWVEANAFERTITGFTASGSNVRTILFSGGTLTGTHTFRIFPHRIVGSTSSARHRQVLDVHLGMGGLEVVSGLRRRDRMQLITGSTNSIFGDSGGRLNGGHGGTGALVGTSTSTGIILNGVGFSTTALDRIELNSANSPGNRPDQFNQPRTLGVYMYEFCGRVL